MLVTHTGPRKLMKVDTCQCCMFRSDCNQTIRVAQTSQSGNHRISRPLPELLITG